jgi:hypothetical protein
MSHESKTAWLQSLKPGDEVIVSGSRPGSVECVRKVERITKTLIIVGRTRFNRERGQTVGGGWHHCYLDEATPGAMRQLEHDALRRSLIYKLQDVTWYDMPLDTLVAVDALLPSPKGDKGEPR